MSILTGMYLRFTRIACLFITSLLVVASCKPREDVVLRQVKDIVVDASTEPVLQANAIFYNPNNMRMKLRKLDLEVYVNDKLSATIDQKLDTRIPARAEFTVPLEVKLNLKEKGFLNTVFKVIGGKKLKVHYKGTVSITYKGIPVRVPVDYEDEVRMSF